jgi:hypothetical protein
MKIKLIAIFIVIAIILFGYHLTPDSLAVQDIPYKKIDSIEIFNGGFRGERVVIDNKDSIVNFNKILLSSQKVYPENINKKSHSRFFIIVLRLKNDKPINLYLLKTFFSGDILIFGDFCYQNTSMLNFILHKFEVN